MPTNKIVRRLDLNRPLTYQELDYNFQFGNFWETTRVYLEDMVVIHDLGNGCELFKCVVPTATQASFVFPGDWERIGPPVLPPGGSGTVGLPTDGAYGTDTDPIGFFTGIQAGDTYEDAFDKVESFLEKIVPEDASLVGTLTIDLPNLFSGSELTSGTVRSNITTDVQPIGTVSDTFRDGARGSLTGQVDATTALVIAMTKGVDDSGIYTNGDVTLNLTQVGFPIGSSNPVYESLQGTIQSDIALTENNIQHTYKVEHDTPLSTLNENFFVDASLATPTFTVTTIEGNEAVGPIWISGVPSLDVGDSIRCTYDVDDAVSYFYNTTRITRVESAFATDANVPNVPIPTLFGQTFTVTNFDLTVINGVSTEDASVTIKAWNARGTEVGDTDQTISTGTASSIRIDTVSDESLRLISGVGQFPALGAAPGEAGDPFVSTVDLNTAGNEELQMYQGRYRYPDGDFTTNLPTAGPDYTGVPFGTFNNIRWVLIDVGNIPTAVNSIRLQFEDPQNFGTNTIVPNFYMQVRIINGIDTNGWIDANAAFQDGISPDPTDDGDAALDFADSTSTIKDVTFGTIARDGDILVRVGIPDTSTIEFKNINLI